MPENASAPHLDDAGLARFTAHQCSREEEESFRIHLTECPACAGRAATAAKEAADLAAPDLEPSLEKLARGALVGRYIVLQEVGEGGMGVVYAAFDPELDRKVALKLLSPSRALGKTRTDGHARLLREAQAMARVSHPNVVPVYDVGTFQERIFLAMEYVEGVTLRKWLKTDPPWRKVVESFVAAGRGLAAAHKAGLTHRDFKPDNVLVSSDGRILVADFGLARLAEDPRQLETQDALLDSGSNLVDNHLTYSGQMIGTPNYMAPEQHLGLTADARADQFSFCASLYYALYGQRPFEPKQLAQAASSSRSGSGRMRTLSFQATSPETQVPVRGVIRPPPSRPFIPRFIKRTMMRGLSLEPEDRFSSMEELLSRLSGPPPSVRRAWGVAGAVALLAGVALTVRAALIARSQVCAGAERRLSGVWDAEIHSRAQAAFRQSGKPFAEATWRAAGAALDTYAQRWALMHREACEATRLRGEQTERTLEQRMGCLDRRLRNIEALSRLWQTADAKAVERAVESVSALPALQSCENLGELSHRDPPPEGPAARAEYERISQEVAEARALHVAGRFKEAREVEDAAVADGRKLGHRPLLAEALERLASTQGAASDAREGARNLREAYYLAEAGGDDELRAEIASYLTFVVGYIGGDPKEGHQWALQSQAILDRMGGNAALQADLWLNLTGVYAREANFAAAKDLNERGLALVTQALNGDPLRRLRFLSNLGSAYLSLGEPKKAEAVLEEGLALSEKVRGPGHPEAAAQLDNLAEAYSVQHRYDEALAIAQRALALIETNLGPVNARAANLRHTLASVLQRQGKYTEALAEHRTAFTVYMQTLGPDHPDLAYVLGGMGVCQLELGHPKEAVELLEKALALKNEDPSMLAEAHFGLARALWMIGRDSEHVRLLAVKAREEYLSQGMKDEAAAVETWRSGLGR